MLVLMLVLMVCGDRSRTSKGAQPHERCTYSNAHVFAQDVLASLCAHSSVFTFSGAKERLGESLVRSRNGRIVRGAKYE